MTTQPTEQRPTQTGAKQLYRHQVTCSQCGFCGDIPWRGRENVCPECQSVEMRR